MKRYAQIKDGQFDRIVPLRGGYLFLDGTSTGSIEAFTDAQLALKGIYPLEEVSDVIDSRTQKYDVVIYDIQVDKVVANRSAISKTQEELAADFQISLKNVRAKRKAELIEYSWLLAPLDALPFTSEAKRQEGLACIRALRDITYNVVIKGTNIPVEGGLHPDDVKFPDILAFLARP